MIETQELTRRFGPVIALDGLSLAVPEGITGLVGVNGAGKSTLIKILLGLLPPTDGTATVLDLNVTIDGPAIRSRVGYMPEHDCLPPDVSATELVVHLARMSGLPRIEARERAADVLRHVGLYEERYRAIGGYSTGMKQRVKLAQTLAHDPRLVLLDEPTNGLDPLGRDEMLALIRRIGADFGISILVTSHLLGEIERICDHVVVIDGGRLLRSSATAEITGHRGVITVEVDTAPDILLRVLLRTGLRARKVESVVEVELTDDTVYDTVRDLVDDADLGLVRLERRRHRLAEVFLDQADELEEAR